MERDRKREGLRVCRAAWLVGVTAREFREIEAGPGKLIMRDRRYAETVTTQVLTALNHRRSVLGARSPATD
jgi:hypothetical protein